LLFFHSGLKEGAGEIGFIAHLVGDALAKPGFYRLFSKQQSILTTFFDLQQLANFIVKSF